MQITSYTQLKEIMDKFNIAPNKRFGQNFLLDQNVLNNIANSANIDKNTDVLEIGPGMGALTNQLAKRAKNVVAIEIDNGMLPILNHTLSEHNNVEIISGDVLDNSTFEKALSLLTKPFNIAANLPYYITTPIIMKFLENSCNVNYMVLMMQKEVAKRICAKPGTKDYGILTIAINFYADTELLFDVSPNSFYPKPNVDSIVIRLSKLEKPRVDVLDKDLFFRTIKASFNMRRKTIINNLTSGFDLDKQTLLNILEKCNIPSNIRGETLSIEQFATLSNEIYQNM